MTERLQLAIFAIPAGIVIYFVVRMLFRVFSPRPPENVITQIIEVDKNTASGNWYDDSDIFRVDESIMKAELKKPGSTLLIYFGRYYNKIPMAIGSYFCSFIVLGWVRGILPVNFWTILAFLIFGLSFLLAPLLMWYVSRPRPLRG